MRLKSAIWVSAFLRRWQVQGHYGAVIRKGAEEAGAIFVIVNHLDGGLHLFGPAPGASHDESGERRWIDEAGGRADQAAIDAILQRRLKADPDVWVVEIEDRDGTAGLMADPG